MIKITNKKTNGHQEEYNPEVEFQYLDADVWFKDEFGERDIAYSEDVQKRLEEESEEDTDTPDNQN